MAKAPLVLDIARARHLWIAAQRLDSPAPFGVEPAATHAAIAHLGYVQIDTINAIERCHHHILAPCIPDYRRSDLVQAQSSDKSVFEYWTYALSYVPTADLPFFLPAMRQYRLAPSRWFGSVTPQEVKAMAMRLRREGPLSIRDIGDDTLVDKDHPWASRKPSKRVLEMMFYQGLVAIGARQIVAYKLDRALRSQGLVSLDSICHLDAPSKAAVKAIIDSRVRAKKLVPVIIAGNAKLLHLAAPETLDTPAGEPPELVHILSSFDPLIIQRKRLKLFFGYDRLFEAYLPAFKRKLGYFALPVLLGDCIVAAFGLKTDRAAGKLIVQRWTRFADVGAAGQAAIDAALHRFEKFRLGA
ncbi:MAG: winged helix DNA-binding domain-containing protein [Candidatus Devosia euplotis]|nr:winged helix DNA-binding domain-containing protein [Candidatus Devosia euplotis]